MRLEKIGTTTSFQAQKAKSTTSINSLLPTPIKNGGKKLTMALAGLATLGMIVVPAKTVSAQSLNNQAAPTTPSVYIYEHGYDPSGRDTYIVTKEDADHDGIFERTTISTSPNTTSPIHETEATVPTSPDDEPPVKFPVHAVYVDTENGHNWYWDEDYDGVADQIKYVIKDEYGNTSSVSSDTNADGVTDEYKQHMYFYMGDGTYSSQVIATDIDADGIFDTTEIVNGEVANNPFNELTQDEVYEMMHKKEQEAYKKRIAENPYNGLTEDEILEKLHGLGKNRPENPFHELTQDEVHEMMLLQEMLEEIRKKAQPTEPQKTNLTEPVENTSTLPVIPECTEPTLP